VTVEFDAIGTFPSVEYNDAGDNYPRVSPYSSIDLGAPTITPISGGVHMSMTWNTQTYDKETINLGWYSPGRWAISTPATRACTITNIIIDGNEFGAPNLAMDVARSNNGYIYVGTPNKVWKSTDGGFTWTESLDDHGSNDLVIDPQLAGVYYHWSDAGNLELVVADVVSGSALDTEAATATPLRLARDLNSGRLWALKSGTTLRLRNAGVWSDLDTGLAGARGLHAYLGGKLIYLDGGAILYSDDYGATQTDKTGDWSGFGSPVNAHLMSTA
jgi:hypothetical protein